MSAVKRHTGSAIMLAVLVAAVVCVGCGGGEKSESGGTRSAAPAVEGVVAKASAVTVTYYYLPG
jgi:hypothetical protein